MNALEKRQHLEALASRAETERIAILDERLQMTRSFYELKKQGQKYGFISQPSFICIQIGPLLPSKKMAFTNQGLIDAVDLWCSLNEKDENSNSDEQSFGSRSGSGIHSDDGESLNIPDVPISEYRAVAEARYGDIRAWNTSQVTDTSNLFREKRAFNDDISRWNTSKVITMAYMFHNAYFFNGDTHAWDVSRVTDMQFMLCNAHTFNGDLHAWDVSNVTNMRSMFNDAHAFNGDIRAWDVSSVKSMFGMFFDASAFDGDIHAWNVSSVTNMQSMFVGCPITVQNKPTLSQVVAVGW